MKTLQKCHPIFDKNSKERKVFAIINLRVDGGMVDAIHSKCIDSHHEGSSPSLPNKTPNGYLSDKLNKKTIIYELTCDRGHRNTGSSNR